MSSTPGAPAIPDLVQTAVRHQQAGRLKEAEAIYRQILRRDPDHAEVLHAMGILARQLGRNDLALAYVGRAVQCNPSVPAFHHNYGELWLLLGDADQAIAAYRKSIALRPDGPESYASLGIVYQQQGRIDDAVAALGRAVALKMDHPEIHHRLSVALLKQGNIQEAAAAAREAIRCQPRFAEAHHTLGEALGALQRNEEAIGSFRRSIELKPDFALAHNGLGTALAYQGKLDEAAAAFETALRLRPQFPEAQHGLGVIYFKQSKFEEAIAAFQKVLLLRPDDLAARTELALTLEKVARFEDAASQYAEILRRGPANPEIEFHLAALTGKGAPAAPPPAAMAKFFDGYAERFDSHLTGKLNYRGPQLLFEAVAACNPGSNLSVLDLGCGTGLCGPLFREMAASLIGVDLSPAMLEKARERRVYDQLDTADLVTAMNGASRKYDLILAADVLIYLGDLAPVFRAAAGALRPGGLFAFTAESHEGEAYRLLPTRRYAHSVRYVRRAAAAAGLQEESLQSAVSRSEHLKPLDGLVMVLRAPST